MYENKPITFTFDQLLSMFKYLDCLHARHASVPGYLAIEFDLTRRQASMVTKAWLLPSASEQIKSRVTNAINEMWMLL